VIEPAPPVPLVEVLVVEPAPAVEPLACTAATNGGHLPCRLVAGHSGLHQLADGTVFAP